MFDFQIFWKEFRDILSSYWNIAEKLKELIFFFLSLLFYF